MIIWFPQALGIGTFQGKFNTGGIWQNSHAKLFYLLYFLFTNSILYLEMFLLNFLVEMFSGFGFLGKNFPGRGISRVIWKRSEIKVFSKSSMLRRIFSGWLVPKTFYRGWKFRTRTELSGRNFTGAGCISNGRNFTRRRFPWGEVTFHRG